MLTRSDPYALTLFVVSDPHITYPVQHPERLSMDSVRLFEETLSDIAACDADGVLFTGDIMEAREYALKNLDLSFGLMKKLTVPWLVLMGNHDIPYRSTKDGYTKADFIRRFAGHGPADGVAYWRHDWPHKKITVFGLDTTVQTSCDGAVDVRQLEWLARNLRDVADDRYVIILTHHPVIVFDREISDVDELQIFVARNHGAVRQVIESYDQVKVVISGHNHTRRHIQQNGVHYIGCPSINSWPAMYTQFSLNRESLDFRYLPIADQSKNAEIRSKMLADTSPWVHCLGSAEAVAGYFTRGPLHGTGELR